MLQITTLYYKNLAECHFMPLCNMYVQCIVTLGYSVLQTFSEMLVLATVYFKIQYSVNLGHFKPFCTANFK